MVRFRVLKRGGGSHNGFTGARINNERGIALVLSLVMLVLLAVLGSWVLNTSSTELRIAGNATNRDIAFYCGDAGVAYGTNTSLLTERYTTALNDHTPTAQMSYGPFTVGACSFSGNVQYVSTGQLPPMTKRFYDQNTYVDTSNETQRRFNGLYFIVDASGNAAGNTIVPIQMGVMQVVGN